MNSVRVGWEWERAYLHSVEHALRQRFALQLGSGVLQLPLHQGPGWGQGVSATRTTLANSKALERAAKVCNPSIQVSPSVQCLIEINYFFISPHSVYY